MPRDIEYHDTYVIKRGPPAEIQLESARLRAAAGLSAGRVPRVVREEGGALHLERIDDLVAVGHHLPRARDRAGLCERVGAVLAHVHRDFHPPGVDCAQDQVALHGDYSAYNIQLHLPTDELVLLDWLPAAWLPDAPLCGPPSVDLAVLWLSLGFQPVMSRYSLRHPGRLALAALEGYQRAGGSASAVEVARTTVDLLPAYEAMRFRTAPRQEHIRLRPTQVRIRWFLNTVVLLDRLVRGVS